MVFEKMKKKLSNLKTEFIDESIVDIPQKSFQSAAVKVEEAQEQIREARETLNRYDEKSVDILGINATITKEDDNEPYNDISDDKELDDVTVTNIPYIQDEIRYTRAIDNDFDEIESAGQSEEGKLPFDLNDIEDIGVGEETLPLDDQLLLNKFENERKANIGRTSVTVVYDEKETINHRTYHFLEDRTEFTTKYLMELDTYGYFTGKDERGHLVTINPAKCYTVEIYG